MYIKPLLSARDRQLNVVASIELNLEHYFINNLRPNLASTQLTNALESWPFFQIRKGF